MKATFLGAFLALVLTSGEAVASTTIDGVGKPNVMDGYTFTLQAGKRTVVDVHGLDDGDVDCYLYAGTFKQHNASFVASDTTDVNGCRFVVVPTTTGTY